VPPFFHNGSGEGAKKRSAIEKKHKKKTDETVREKILRQHLTNKNPCLSKDSKQRS